MESKNYLFSENVTFHESFIQQCLVNLILLGIFIYLIYLPRGLLAQAAY